MPELSEKSSNKYSLGYDIFPGDLEIMKKANCCGRSSRIVQLYQNWSVYPEIAGQGMQGKKLDVVLSNRAFLWVWKSYIRVNSSYVPSYRRSKVLLGRMQSWVIVVVKATRMPQRAMKVFQEKRNHCKQLVFWKNYKMESTVVQAPKRASSSVFSHFITHNKM